VSGPGRLPARARAGGFSRTPIFGTPTERSLQLIWLRYPRKQIWTMQGLWDSPVLLTQLKNELTALIVVVVVAVGVAAGYFARTSTLPASIITTKTAYLTTTQTEVSDYTYTTLGSAAVESSGTACIPSSSYISTTTISEQSTTATEQLVYDGTICSFGDNIFEAPSAILIPANTLVWTNFRLKTNGTYNVGATIDFLSVSDLIRANITVAVYLNGHLNASSTTPVTQLASAAANPSSIPPANSSSNSIFALKGVTPTGGVGTQTGSAVNLSGATITVAIISDEPLWLSGWTPQDMSKGTGPQFGQSVGQLSGTYEWPDSGLSLPNTLPQPTTTLQFQLEIPGSYEL